MVGLMKKFSPMVSQLTSAGVGNEDPFRTAFPKCTILSCVVSSPSVHKDQTDQADLGRSEPEDAGDH